MFLIEQSLKLHSFILLRTKGYNMIGDGLTDLSVTLFTPDTLTSFVDDDGSKLFDRTEKRLIVGILAISILSSLLNEPESILLCVLFKIFELSQNSWESWDSKLLIVFKNKKMRAIQLQEKTKTHVKVANIRSQLRHATGLISCLKVQFLEMNFIFFCS